MGLLFWLLILIASLYFLVKSSDYLVISAEKIGYYFRLSPIIIGTTILAFGTSLPELITSLFAVFKNSTEIIIGNVIGSNIANILFVLGIAVFLTKRFRIKGSVGDTTMLLIASIFLILTTIDGYFTLMDGITGIILFIIYLIRVKRSHDRHLETVDLTNNEKKLDKKTTPMFITSIIAIYFSAEYTITSVIELSKLLNIGTEVLAASVIALGTSLPEVMVSVAAAKKNKLSLALGNVVGSNIFNILLVMGIPALITNLAIPDNIIFLGIPFFIISTLMFYQTFKDKIMTRNEGYMYLGVYALFLILLYTRF